MLHVAKELRERQTVPMSTVCTDECSILIECSQRPQENGLLENRLFQVKIKLG